jgi:hypothetical protein
MSSMYMLVRASIRIEHAQQTHMATYFHPRAIPVDRVDSTLIGAFEFSCWKIQEFRDCVHVIPCVMPVLDIRVMIAPPGGRGSCFLS